MQKPNNYDSVSAASGFRRPTAGKYIMKVVRAYEQQSSKNNDMLVLDLDIAEGEFAGYFKDLSNSLDKNIYIRHYRVNNEDNAQYLKSDIEKIEKSNPGYTFNWDENTLSGKLVGANLVEEEYTKSNGDIGKSLKLKWLYSLSGDDVGGYDVGTSDPRNEESVPF